MPDLQEKSPGIFEDGMEWNGMEWNGMEWDGMGSAGILPNTLGTVSDSALARVS